MTGLATFSIESDDLVLLTFNDGKVIRAHVNELPKLLSKPDAAKVKTAYEARSAYIKHTLPYWARGVVVAVVVLSLCAGSVEAFRIFEGQIPNRGTSGKPPTGAPAHINKSTKPASLGDSSSARERITPVENAVSGGEKNLPPQKAAEQLPSRTPPNVLRSPALPTAEPLNTSVDVIVPDIVPVPGLLNLPSGILNLH